MLTVQSGEGGKYTIVDAESAVLWFAYKRMLPETKLSDYLGRNEKTKVSPLPDLMQDWHLFHDGWGFPEELKCKSGDALRGSLAYLTNGTLLNSQLCVTGNCAASDI